MALPRELAAVEAVDRRSRRRDAAVQCVLLDPGEHCSLRESLAGYEAALATLGEPFVRTDARSAPRCALLIVPGVLRISHATASVIRACLNDGTTVIVESGAGFADPDDAEFRAHRDSLREELQLHVASPISLWPRSANADAIPYVDYSWPAAARVRDFSRVVPLGSQARTEEIIARVNGLPVALMRRGGLGTLVFLGSPLGPALRSGDAEARQWLSDVAARSRSTDSMTLG
jgi:hypothetical protein